MPLNDDNVSYSSALGAKRCCGNFMRLFLGDTTSYQQACSGSLSKH